MAGLPIPAALAEAVAEHPRDGRRDWLVALPDLVADVARRWRLLVGPPYEPGGQCAWVAPVVSASGDPLALKVGWPHPEARDEAAALRLWRGEGAVTLHAAEEVGSATVLLLERCEPGTPLAASADPDERDHVVAGLLRRLWVIPPRGHGFRPLAQMCDDWAEEFEEKWDRARHAGLPVPDRGLAADGAALFRALPRERHDEVVLCTDLHAENILASSREPWLAIDPKPYVGDPCYDVLQHMLNEDRLDADAIALCQRMATLTDLDADRVTQWMFARCVQESVDSPRLVRVAEALAASL